MKPEKLGKVGKMTIDVLEYGYAKNAHALSIQELNITKKDIEEYILNIRNKDEQVCHHALTNLSMYLDMIAGEIK